jgi:hybrid polyketide synthase/nonribosomal peptide synthetase ACE1
MNVPDTPKLFSPLSGPHVSRSKAKAIPLSLPKPVSSSNKERSHTAVAKVPKIEADKKITFSRTERMSYGSSRFWFLKQYLEDPNTFNVVFSTRIEGHLRIPDCERAVQKLGQRHEALRTAFFADETKLGEPTQGVLPLSRLRLETKRIGDESEVEKEVNAMMNYTFDLEKGENIRMQLLTLNPELSFLIWGYHHISMDGFSLNVLIADLNKFYMGQPLPPVARQFADFGANQRREVARGAMTGELKFWKSEFPDFPDPLPLLPMAKVNSRQVLSRYDFEQVEYTLDPALVGQIKDQCRKLKATTFHFCLAILKIMMFRLIDIDDIVIGIADANRTESSTSETVGFLLNLLPLRFKADEEQSFGDALKEARTKAYAALTNSKLPFDVLLEELEIPRSSTYSPLFQIFMDYRNVAAKSPPMMNCKAEATATPGRTAYDIVMDINEFPGNDITLSFRTQKYLYSKRATELLLRSYVHLLKLFATDPTSDPSTVKLWDPVDVKAATKIGQGIFKSEHSKVSDTNYHRPITRFRLASNHLSPH